MTHIEHTAVIVDDYDTAIEFYVNALRFELVVGFCRYCRKQVGLAGAAAVKSLRIVGVYVDNLEY